MPRKATKKRPGRPSAAEGRVKFTTTLPANIVEALREIGGGNASQAIIILVEAAMAIQVSRRTLAAVKPLIPPEPLTMPDPARPPQADRKRR